MLGVVAGDGAQPVGREELLLVEEPRQEPEHPRHADDAEQDASLPDVSAHRMGAPEQPGGALVHDLRAVDDLLLDRGDAEERQDADDRAHLDRHLRPVRQPQPVVEEPVALVPEALRFERLRDQGEVLEELQDEVGCRPAPVVEDRGDRGHAQRVEAHPAGAVGLLEQPAVRQVRAVERPDVVEAEEAAFEDVRAVAILAVHPPGEVDEQLVEDPLRNSTSRPPSIANTSSAAHAWTGGLTSSNAHS